MAAMGAQMRVEQFLALPEEEAFRRELIRGEIVEMVNARLFHEIVKGILNKLLAVYTVRHPEFFLIPETIYLVSESDAFQPDLSLARTAEVARKDPFQRQRGTPLLAVEIVSSETAERIDYKVEVFLQRGAEAVWVVYPEHQSVTAHYRDGFARRLHLADTLEEPAILPGFSVPLRELFKPLT